MIQPIGTKVYRGRRVSVPGNDIIVSKDKETQAKFDNLLNKAGDFNAEGKAVEKKAKAKDVKKVQQKPEQKKPDFSESQGDKK